jgi:hypothetical protein
MLADFWGNENELKHGHSRARMIALLFNESLSMLRTYVICVHILDLLRRYTTNV